MQKYTDQNINSGTIYNRTNGDGITKGDYDLRKEEMKNEFDSLYTSFFYQGNTISRYFRAPTNTVGKLDDSEVRWCTVLQIVLEKAGINDLNIKRKYEDVCVSNFERVLQLRTTEEFTPRSDVYRIQDHIIDKVRNYKYFSAGSSSSKLSQDSLELVSKPREIAEAQDILNSLGYNTGVVDGRIGPKTREAVRKYFGNNGDLTYEVLDTLRKSRE